MTSEAARAWFPHFDWLWRSMMRSGRRLRRLHSSSANLQARCVFLGKSSQEISASLTKRCVSQDFAAPRPRGEVGGACTRKRGVCLFRMRLRERRARKLFQRAVDRGELGVELAAQAVNRRNDRKRDT